MDSCSLTLWMAPHLMSLYCVHCCSVLLSYGSGSICCRWLVCIVVTLSCRIDLALCPVALYRPQEAPVIQRRLLARRTSVIYAKDGATSMYGGRGASVDSSGPVPPSIGVLSGAPLHAVLSGKGEEGEQGRAGQGEDG